MCWNFQGTLFGFTILGIALDKSLSTMWWSKVSSLVVKKELEVLKFKMVSGGWILMEAHLESQNHGGTIKNDKKMFVAFSGWSNIRDSNRAEMEAITEGLFYSKNHVPPLIAEGDP